MAAISIKFEGLDAAFKKLSAKGENIKEGISDELNAWALDTVTLAKNNCPVDEGFLRNSINANFSTPKKLEAEITVGANYGAYIEFGTRGYAARYVSTLPKDWKELASSFKGGGGKNGSFKDYLIQILRWVKRKGIDEKAAYPIAMAIIRKGIKPQPYLRPAVNATRKKLIDRIKKVIES
jgi:HK97 gp10 family phage protein